MPRRHIILDSLLPSSYDLTPTRFHSTNHLRYHNPHAFVWPCRVSSDNITWNQICIFELWVVMFRNSRMEDDKNMNKRWVDSSGYFCSDVNLPSLLDRCYLKFSWHLQQMHQIRDQWVSPCIEHQHPLRYSDCTQLSWIFWSFLVSTSFSQPVGQVVIVDISRWCLTPSVWLMPW